MGEREDRERAKGKGNVRTRVRERQWEKVRACVVVCGRVREREGNMATNQDEKTGKNDGVSARGGRIM